LRPLFRPLGAIIFAFWLQRSGRLPLSVKAYLQRLRSNPPGVGAAGRPCAPGGGAM